MDREHKQFHHRSQFESENLYQNCLHRTQPAYERQPKRVEGNSELAFMNFKPEHFMITHSARRDERSSI